MAAAAETSLIKPRLQLLAGLVLALSNFIVVLDLTIANVSVPHIAGNLGITLDQGTWVITSYAVAEAICVPLTGWLAQRFGTVRVFLYSMLGFGLFSLLCGLSPTLDMLVICRIGQGLCGGPLMPMSQTLLTRVFPPERRGMALGLWAMTALLGPAFGPIIGGWITDNWSWHWIFLINVPIAVSAALAGYVLLKPAETPTMKLPIDRIGLMLLVFWIGCLQIMLDIGRDRDWFGDWKVVVLAVCAAVGFLVFIIWELTDDHPIVDLRVFRHRGYWTNVMTFSLCFGAFFSSVVVIPQWLQVTLGYTATQSGMMTALSGAASVLATPFAVRLLPRVDTRILVTGSALWMAITTVMRTTWSAESDFWTLAVPIALQGLAMPFLMMPLTNATMSSVLPEEAASGAGLQNFVRTMAIAMSTSIVLTFWGNHQRIARDGMVSGLHPDDLATRLGNLGMPQDAVPGVLSGMVDKESISLALNHVFWLSTCVFLFSLILIWMSPRISITRLTGKPPVDMH